MTSFDELLERAEALVARGGRTLLGIVGAPASGKTTLAWGLANALGNRATVVGMDGFHLAQVELRRLGRTERKGAPDTFDAHGYVNLLSRIKAARATVYAPEFRREIEEPIAGAVPVSQDVPLVITEGNYLLLETEPWREVRGLLDEAWFLAPDEHDRVERLVTRHRRYGRSLVEARQRALGSDQRNADLIGPSAARADLVLENMPLANFAI
ncbi:nucleoside/nucleotide kinase family protein [Amycolatopsis acidiphila]|uniref:Nucleoside/nucleotide kinase family protein n=1 Tax=Amycolatopsis acidiphila TaxID=715473 RepID=A0A558AGT5_9PSEU|nr:nucleoside/nucleotide kinase family protein [Amycolatopsis acidiphila]TVT23479.1 nucleoside/nucleotide kinase family protein [Amycolatopsis acidiphila]UIJ59938.1 nucleoside/nucleotide kinase family protein [Amycolatopsis acidiphila]GHG62322.1 nucleoside/nucleotide kinase family protein [Amycolatopsis acidiphila]